MEHSIVGDLINFQASENAPWRTEHDVLVPSVDTMVGDIAKWQTKWMSAAVEVDQEKLKDVKRDILMRFIFHVNTEEEYGIRDSVEEVKECLDSTSPPTSVPEQETHNVEKAYLWLNEEVEKETCNLQDGEESLRGILEPGLIRDLHKMIVVKAPGGGGTQPGQFSEYPRLTTWKGGHYEYQHPPNMSQAVQTLLDRYNSLLNEVKNEEGKEGGVYKLFKVCGYLIFELLDLHPFGDGNGRLCRLLCSYILSVMTPFPTPIYNIWSTSSKNCYKQALVDAREKYDRKPLCLTTMIIESNWLGWQDFFKQLGNKT